LRATSGLTQRLAKILRVEPFERLQGRTNIVVSDPGRVHVILSITFLVDRLNAIARHSPLTPQPIDIAVQSHDRILP